MKTDEMFFTLKGVINGQEFVHIALDMRYLQELLTKVLRVGGSGFIYKGVLE